MRRVRRLLSASPFLPSGDRILLRGEGAAGGRWEAMVRTRVASPWAQGLYFLALTHGFKPMVFRDITDGAEEGMVPFLWFLCRKDTVLLI